MEAVVKWTAVMNRRRAYQCKTRRQAERHGHGEAVRPPVNISETALASPFASPSCERSGGHPELGNWQTPGDSIDTQISGHVLWSPPGIRLFQ